MTPCEKAGYHVGDRFVLQTPIYDWQIGDRIELIKDDGTDCPKFDIVEKKRMRVNPCFISLSDVRKTSAVNPRRESEPINVWYVMNEDCHPTTFLPFSPGTLYTSSIPKPTIMQNISSFFRNITLSSDEKLLLEMGLEDPTGEPTQEALELSDLIDYRENRAEIIELAKQMKAEKEAKK